MPATHRRARPARGSGGSAGSGWAWPGWTAACAFAATGLSLVLQPGRFARTPAYANLTELLDTRVWGGLYVLCAVLLAVYLLAVPQRAYAVLAHTAATMLVGGWLVAFLIRYLTNDATTLVNVVSWSVLLTLVILSGLLIDVSARARRPAAFPAVVPPVAGPPPEARG